MCIRDRDISPFAIATLADFYGVSTDYLLGLTENKNHPNTELQSLHLSDDMVELLSSGKINNRLLCEDVYKRQRPASTFLEISRLYMSFRIFLKGVMSIS